MEAKLTPLGELLLAGDTTALQAQVTAALDAGRGPRQLLDEDLMPAMDLLGERFSDGEAFLPELLLAAETMKGALAVLAPALQAEAGEGPAATLVIGTVQGDIHDLGKNLVRVMFEGAGFRVVDLGTNVPADAFVAACAAETPQLVGLSSLLSNTMGQIKGVIEAVRASHPGVKCLVGGAPLTAELARQIGADGYAPDAHQAVQEGRRLLG